MVVIPGVLLVAVNLWYGLYIGNRYLVYWIPSVAVSVALFYGGFRVKSAWRRSHAAPDVLWTSGGQFRADQLRGAPYLGRILASTKDTYGGSRGWVVGNLAITQRGIDFSPSYFSKGDGVQGTHIPWGAVTRIKFVPERLSLGTGLELYLMDGSSVDCEVHDGPQLRRQLEALSRPAKRE